MRLSCSLMIDIPSKFQPKNSTLYCEMIGPWLEQMGACYKYNWVTMKKYTTSYVQR